MAKIAPKGKKVTGTNKKDKITWTSSKLWKKNLTVKAGGGNDIINFKKSKYKNTIYGDAGNDKNLRSGKLRKQLPERAFKRAACFFEKKNVVQKL